MTSKNEHNSIFKKKDPTRMRYQLQIYRSLRRSSLCMWKRIFHKTVSWRTLWVGPNVFSYFCYLPLQKKGKFFKRVYSEFPVSYLKLFTTTKSVNFLKCVYWKASYIQLPTTTMFSKIVKIDTWLFCIFVHVWRRQLQ